MNLHAQYSFLSSYRPKRSKLSVNPGAAGGPPKLPRSAHGRSQHGPVCPVHEHKGQSGNITAALQSPRAHRPSWASASSAYPRQAPPARCSGRSAPHTPDAQASLTPHVCAFGYSRRRGSSCDADSHDNAAGSAPPGSAGSEAGTEWSWRRSGEYEPCRRSTRGSAASSRGQTASRAQPSLSRWTFV